MKTFRKRAPGPWHPFRPRRDPLPEPSLAAKRLNRASALELIGSKRIPAPVAKVAPTAVESAPAPVFATGTSAGLRELAKQLEAAAAGQERAVQAQAAAEFEAFASGARGAVDALGPTFAALVEHAGVATRIATEAVALLVDRSGPRTLVVERDDRGRLKTVRPV